MVLDHLHVQNVFVAIVHLFSFILFFTEVTFITQCGGSFGGSVDSYWGRVQDREVVFEVEMLWGMLS